MKLTEQQKESLRFQITEYIGRDIFSTFEEQQKDITYLEIIPFNASWKITQQKHYDFIICSAGTLVDWCIEIKVKKERTNTPYVINGGVILAKAKYDDLINDAKKNNSRPVYVNYFAGDGVFVFWFLDTTPKRYDPEYLRQGNNSFHQRDKVPLPTYFLDVNDGVHYPIKQFVSLDVWHKRAKHSLSIFASDMDIKYIDTIKEVAK